MQRVLGKKLTMELVRQTFFRHFCAGETQAEVGPVMEKLKSHGVGGILDYAAEEDVTKEEGKCPWLSLDHTPSFNRIYCVGELVEVRTEAREGVMSARTYDYTSEDKCDMNMRIMLDCIDMAAATTERPFSAIKVGPGG